ncbi:MAG: NADH-quinone oxidoreductase subunit L [Raineya sp.]|nr:NADH-quinone oxidoreductase subunit L [Raineya sp.]
MIATLFLQLLFSAFVLSFLKNKPKITQGISFLSLLLNVIFCGILLTQYFSDGYTWQTKWVNFIAFRIGIALQKIELLMLALVALIAFAVTIFSHAYMRGEKNFHLYFTYLVLFVFAMQMLIVADNFLQTYVFWELVGFCSYLLISFWREKSEAVRASRKAFLVNRIGDTGFLIGIFLIFNQFHTLSFGEISALLTQKNFSAELLTLAGICIFLGAMAKSAQFPLHVWLSDAMQAPTPISALLHAATMVAAGVFLVVKIFFLLTPTTLQFIQIVGLISMLLGAYKAIFQSNIKKLLAYSTISQLGLMFVAVGAGSPQAGFFHLLTHAFFKAGLFLCAGVILYHSHHFAQKVPLDSENMYLLGGLRKKLTWLFVFYTICMLSLLGFPFTAGFLSKEMILTTLWHNTDSFFGKIAFSFTLIGFGLTAFYMALQYRSLFFGKFHLQTFYPNFSFRFEKPNFSFVFPLILLAAGSLWIGFSLNPFAVQNVWLVEILGNIQESSVSFLPLVTFGVTFLGFGVGFQKSWAWQVQKQLFAQKIFAWQIQIYRLGRGFGKRVFIAVVAFYRGLQNSLHIAYGVIWLAQKLHKIEKIWDKFLDNLAKTQVVLAHIIHWADKNLIDGFLHFLLWIGRTFGNFARNLQGREIQGYWFFSFVCILVLLAWILFRTRI